MTGAERVRRYREKHRAAAIENPAEKADRLEALAVRINLSLKRDAELRRERLDGAIRILIAALDDAATLPVGERVELALAAFIQLGVGFVDDLQEIVEHGKAAIESTGYGRT